MGVISRRRIAVGAIAGAVAAMAVLGLTAGDSNPFDVRIRRNADDLFERGRRMFRFDTFGDEAFWGGTLRLHEAVEGARFGGVGDGLSPSAALSLGLKVDADALSSATLTAIRNGVVNLNDPAVTLTLLDANAVVGLSAKRGRDGGLVSIGIQCALCHSTVDDSAAPGIGRRLDGWPNRDLNVGAIVALAPDLSDRTFNLNLSEADKKNLVEYLRSL